MTDKIAPGELMNEVNALTRERDKLRAEYADLLAQAIRTAGIYDKEIDMLRAENERLRAHIGKGHRFINDMDLRMPEQATEDADGWINSYRIPTGPWHRLLGWARAGW